jgi:predicted Zn finger-like uncharacterized protein
MKFKCEKCGTRYTIADEKVQNRVLKIRCKVCENVITVRDPDGAGLEAPPSAIRRPTGSRAPAIAAAPLGDDFPNDRTSVGDPLAPVSDVEWYCAPDSGQAGPMPLERLRDMIRTGELKGEDFVWNETMSDWVPASTVNVLGDLFRPKAPRPPPPLPGGPAARPVPPPPPSPVAVAIPTPAIDLGEPPAPIPVPVPAPVVSPKPKRPRSPLADEILAAPPPPPDEPPVRLHPPSPPPEPMPAFGGGSELDVDLLSLLGPVAAPAPSAPPAQEGPPTELMPSSRAPTRPVENDELAAIMAAEMAAPPTVQAPALAEQLSQAPTRTADPVVHGRGGKAAPIKTAKAAKPTAEDNFGFGDLNELPTALPASHSAVHVVHDAPPPRRGLPPALLLGAGAVLVVGGIVLGIWLAPKGDGPAVAAPTAEAVAPVSIAPTTAPTQPPTAAVTQPPTSAPTAPATVAVAEVAQPATGGAEAKAGDSPGAGRPAVAARAPKAAEKPAVPSGPAPPSRPSAFAGLDAARGDNAPKVPDKAAAKGEDLPAGLEQAEISAVIKRNIKAVQGCYQRQLKRDDSVADGRATIRFRIQSDGRAKNVSMDRRFDGTVLQQCIVNTVERWAFPPFEGDPIPVEFPVIFTATF